MIYSHNHKVVIYTPFKNFSSSLQAYYSNKPKFHSIVGPNPNYNFDLSNSINRHTAFVPDDIDKNYKKFLPIRNPYERVISQYNWHLKTCGQISFDEWFMIHSKQPVCQPVTVIYPKFDQVLHVENLVEELRENGLLVKNPSTQEEFSFPHKNATENKIVVNFTNQQRENIYYLHYSDFLVGGYERLYK